MCFKHWWEDQLKQRHQAAEAHRSARGERKTSAHHYVLTLQAPQDKERRAFQTKDLQDLSLDRAKACCLVLQNAQYQIFLRSFFVILLARLWCFEQQCDHSEGIASLGVVHVNTKIIIHLQPVKDILSSQHHARMVETFRNSSREKFALSLPGSSKSARLEVIVRIIHTYHF